MIGWVWYDPDYFENFPRFFYILRACINDVIFDIRMKSEESGNLNHSDLDKIVARILSIAIKMLLDSSKIDWVYPFSCWFETDKAALDGATFVHYVKWIP